MQYVFGANIRQIQTYPSKEQLDVLLFLDDVFNGEVGTATVQDKKLTMISNTQISRNWNRIFNDSPINKLEIIPRNNNVYLNIESKKKYLLKPSISKDKGTIKLSFYLSNEAAHIAQATQYTQPQTPSYQSSFSQNNTSQTPPPPQQAQTTTPQYQQQNESSWLDSIKLNVASEYIYYILGLIVLVAGLFALRYQLNKPSSLNGRIRIAMQSPIDARNRIVVFETKDYFYMVLIGEKNNVLMDKISRYKESKIESKASTIGVEGAFGEEFWNTLKTKQAPIIK